MKKYFKTETHEGYTKLSKLMYINLVIASMCKVLILLKMICCLYLREENIEEPKTATELYIHALLYFIKEHCTMLLFLFVSIFF